MPLYVSKIIGRFRPGETICEALYLSILPRIINQEWLGDCELTSILHCTNNSLKSTLLPIRGFGHELKSRKLRSHPHYSSNSYGCGQPVALIIQGFIFSVGQNCLPHRQSNSFGFWWAPPRGPVHQALAEYPCCHRHAYAVAWRKTCNIPVFLDCLICSIQQSAPARPLSQGIRLVHWSESCRNCPRSYTTQTLSRRTADLRLCSHKVWMNSQTDCG